MSKVANLEIENLCLNDGNISWVKAAEHDNICESAVEIVEENKPARIPPTKIEGSKVVAKIGNANSVSDKANSGSKTREANPTPIEHNEKMTYHKKYK